MKSRLLITLALLSIIPSLAHTDTPLPETFTFKTDDDRCTITYHSEAAPDMKAWAEQKVKPALATWYPKIVALLPSPDFTAPTQFSITVKAMDGVAYTSGTSVTASKSWIEHERDGEGVGSLVHEAVHIVQGYGKKGNGNANPSWLVEGIADYIRWFLYEPQSHGADFVWLKKQKRDAIHYDGSYRFTANFLDWVARKYDSEIIRQMNEAMREGTYSDDLWKTYTGKTAAELGAEWKQESASAR